jgi:hypothetical protein
VACHTAPPNVDPPAADPGQEHFPPDTQDTHDTQLSSPLLLSRTSWTRDMDVGVDFSSVPSTRDQGITAAALRTTAAAWRTSRTRNTDNGVEFSPTRGHGLMAAASRMSQTQDTDFGVDFSPVPSTRGRGITAAVSRTSRTRDTVDGVDFSPVHQGITAAASRAPATDGDGFLPVTSTHGRATATATAALLPPATVEDC